MYGIYSGYIVGYHGHTHICVYIVYIYVYIYSVYIYMYMYIFIIIDIWHSDVPNNSMGPPQERRGDSTTMNLRGKTSPNQDDHTGRPKYGS